MPVVHILEKGDYDLIKKSNIAVIHFYAEWVEQCKLMNDVLDEMSNKNEFKDVVFAKILAEEIPEISIIHKITAVPTFVILRGGQEAGRIEGANPGQLTETLNELVKLPKADLQATSPPKSTVKEIPLEERIKKLINAAPVMLFMKGNANMPRCGFSKQIVAILNEHNVDFKSFDILNDNDIREGLKSYSKWPTYPQLYINGELIGGLDIIKELIESGEFQEKIPRSAIATSLEDRLRGLISQSNVMVFLKGDKTRPRCGFSRQLVEILNNSGVPYETFDILEDEDVRQGLKEFSNWPTYPQVYVNGVLVGGLDVIKEHVENGELNDVLQPKK